MTNGLNRLHDRWIGGVMGLFHYYLFGLRIASEIELPEAIGTEPGAGDQGEAGLEIRQGQVPSQVPDFVAMAGEFEVGRRAVLLRVPGIGRLLMKGGTRITLQLAPGAELRRVRVYVLGVGLGTILHQRGYLVLHGSAVAVGDGVVGFLGHSGAGKSTMAAAFAARGHPILTDDLMAIRFDREGLPEVCPGLPTMKLWPGVADTILPGHGAPFDQASLLKRRVHMPSALAGAALPLSHLHILHWLLPEQATLEIETVKPAKGLAMLRGYCFHPELITPTGRDAEFFVKTSKIAKACPIHIFRRPRSLSAIEKIYSITRNQFASSP